MGGGQSLLRSLRLPDHLHPADDAGQAALLSQLSCAQGAAHLAGLRVAAGGGLSQRALVHRPQRDGRGQGRALAGLSLLRAESLPSGAAPGHRTHLGAGHRGAVLLCVGAAGAVSRGPGCWRPCWRARWSGSPLLRHDAMFLADAHAHADSSGRHRVGQPAGAGDAHAATQPAGLAGAGPGRHCGGLLRPRPPWPAARLFSIPRWR